MTPRSIFIQFGVSFVRISPYGLKAAGGALMAVPVDRVQYASIAFVPVSRGSQSQEFKLLNDALGFNSYFRFRTRLN
jgi:hypothetical protein